MNKMFSIFLIITGSLLASCSKQGAVSPKESVINALTSSGWKAQSVMNEPDGDVTFQYENFSLSFNKKPSGNNNGEYFVASGGSAFPSAYGKWVLSDDLKTMQFDNGETFQVQVSSSELRLEFYITPTSDGRVGSRAEGLAGHFVFVLKH